MSVTTTYRVEGMTCDHCVRAVSQEIGALPGVIGVAVDLSNGAVSITSDAAPSRGAVAKAIDEAGYTLAATA